MAESLCATGGARKMSGGDIFCFMAMLCFAGTVASADCNVQCRIKADPELSKLYRSDVPLFVTASTAHAIEAALPSLAQSPAFKTMLARLTAAYAPFNPHASCAIVGNSQNLLG